MGIGDMHTPAVEHLNYFEVDFSNLFNLVLDKETTWSMFAVYS